MTYRSLEPEEPEEIGAETPVAPDVEQAEVEQPEAEPEAEHDQETMAPSPPPDEAPAHGIDDFFPTHELVTLARMPVMEAEMAAAKLRLRQVGCYIADQNISVADPLVIPYARLQVRSADLRRAREILDEPAAAGGEGEYVDEPWRCSKCHRKTVELKPMSPRLKGMILAFIVLALLPVLLNLLDSVIPPALQAQLAYLGLYWFLVMMALGVGIVLQRRQKRCTSCGHEWGTGEAAK